MLRKADVGQQRFYTVRFDGKIGREDLTPQENAQGGRHLIGTRRGQTMQKQEFHRATRFRKQAMVFSIRQVMVMGPTPPGTGVMTDAFGSTAS